MTDLRSAFNDIPTGYTPTSPIDVNFQEYLRLENLRTPPPLEPYEPDGYLPYPTGHISLDTQQSGVPEVLSYCCPEACHANTDVPISMNSSYSSSSLSTYSANSMQCLEVNTSGNFYYISDGYIPGSETGASTHSTDNSLSPPQSFGSNPDNTLVELKPSISQSMCAYDYISTDLPTIQCEDNYAVYPLKSMSYTEHTNALHRPQTLEIVCKQEFSDHTFEQSSSTLKANDPTPISQEKPFYELCPAKSLHAQKIHGHVAPTTNHVANNGVKQKKVLEKAFICNMQDCTKRFARVDELRRHQRTHSDVKQFVCDCCNKGFTRSDHLMTHRRTHTGERPYPCNYCDRRFARSDERNRHTKVHFREKSKCGRKPKSISVVQMANQVLPTQSIQPTWEPAYAEFSL